MSNLVTFYRCADTYQDRVQMLAHVAARLGPVALFTAEPPSDRLRSMVTSTGLSLHHVPEGRRPIQLRASRAIARYVQAQPTQIVHGTQAFLLPLFARLRLRRVRPVLLASTFAAHYAWPAAAWRMPYPMPSYTRQMLRGIAMEWAEARLVDGITVFAEGHRRPLAKTLHLNAGRVHVLPNCVDQTLFEPVEPDPVALGFATGDFVLLFTGNVFRYKGCYELLEMMRRLVPRYPRLRLAVIGPIHAPERAQIERRLVGLGGVVRLSGKRIPRSDLAGLIQRCHAFVFPSHLEGCPRSVIEAMACAKPIVATRIPGIEALDPTDTFIEYSTVGDSGSLTGAVSRLLESGALAQRRRGEAARAQYLKRHTPRAAAVEWTRFYASLV